MGETAITDYIVHRDSSLINSFIHTILLNSFWESFLSTFYGSDFSYVKEFFIWKKNYFLLENQILCLLFLYLDYHK